MKKVKYKADLSVLKLPADEVTKMEADGQKNLFESYFGQGLNSKYPQGLPGSKGRVAARVYAAIDASNDGNLLLEETEYELLKEAFCSEDVKFAPIQYKLVVQLQKAIETAEEFKVDR